MRRLILLGLMAAVVLPAVALKRVKVAQLEQSLAADAASHRADTDVAHRLGDLELSERLTEATLDRFANNLPLGPRTALALQLLADQSAFLEPPASELPATGMPDAAAQQRMMDLARGYVVRIWPHLPNFFVTRTTTRFDDSPQVLRQGEWPMRAGLHLVGTVTHSLTYRDGVDIIDEVKEPARVAAMAGTNGALAPLPQERGMTSKGDFGPELTIVLTDSAKGKVAWSHWEQTSAGLAAVYNYSVPKAVSHFEVSYCCVTKDVQRELLYGNTSRGQGPSIMDTAQADTKLFQVTPGYHGTLAIDPDSGAILRITIETELKSGGPISKAATMVQYGPVTIGDRTFIFPVRSLAISVEEPGPNSQPEAPSTLLVNQTTFTDYHRLGATIRMFADAPPANPPATGAAGSSAASAIPPSPATPSATPAQPATETAATPLPAAEPLPAPVPAPAEPVVPEVSVSAANGIPDKAASATQPEQGDFQLKLTSRLVDVGIVAWDKHGHPVNDLTAEDFELYDNGRKQDIRSFSAPAASPQPESPATAPTADLTFSNRAPDSTIASTIASAAAPAAASSQSAFAGTILLLDESHIAWPDLNNARGEMLKFLAKAPPAARVGIYTMTGLGFRVIQEITTDHATLSAKLQKWMPSAQSLSQAQEEERQNRQTFEYVHNVNDLNNVNGNHIDVPDDPAQPIDYELLTKGSNPARADFVILAQVARHLSAIPGHKSLVWVSSDNVFADWQDQAVGIDKGPKMVESFARHAQEAMNEAHAAVYPFDVSQLEAGNIGADLQNSSVELTPAAQDNATTAAANGAKSTSSLPPPSTRQTGNGRIEAQISQDLHPIQGAVRDVAAGTGGRTIRRSSDLAAALEGIVEDGRATWQLSFSPQGAPDDQYHTITIKLTRQHKGVSLRYRTGYLYAKEPTTLKDRFRQAIWRPLDVSEIAVTASADPQAAGAKLKIGIAAADLGLEQRGGLWMDKLDIFMIQRDDAGIKAQAEGQTLGLRLKPATYRRLLSSGVPFECAVQMRPGMASLRILVVDENSGRMGSVTIPGAALGATP
jgi:VWFA-related protein